MTPEQALKEAGLVGRLGQFGLSRHAVRRMEERNVTRRDIGHALRSATAAILQEDGSWRIEGGTDDDGEPLTVVVAFTGRGVVVTVF